MFPQLYCNCWRLSYTLVMEKKLWEMDAQETCGSYSHRRYIYIYYIPDPTKIGPYHNIVLHTVSTDINNIKNRNSRSNQELGNIMDDESKSIRYY